MFPEVIPVTFQIQHEVYHLAGPGDKTQLNSPHQVRPVLPEELVLREGDPQVASSVCPRPDLRHMSVFTG